MEHNSDIFTALVVYNADYRKIASKKKMKNISLKLPPNQSVTKIPLLQVILNNYTAYSAKVTTQIKPGHFQIQRCNVSPVFWSKTNKNTFNTLNSIFTPGRVDYFIEDDPIMGLCLVVDYHPSSCESHTLMFRLSRQGS